jgi:uncharacterized protein (DUF2252 family)
MTATLTRKTEVVDPAERAARGRGARSTSPRSGHGEWAPNASRRDPVAVLQAQAHTRVPELVPLRHERMLASPFAFYRGAAAIMAGDLVDTPNSGIRVQCCGDAHLVNFGGFESPERSLVFDINDFDETLPGPWEWDVKRLVASIAIAAQDRDFDDMLARRAVAETTRSYREAMREFATMPNLAVWYAHLDVQSIVDRWRSQVARGEAKRVERLAAKAPAKNSLKAFAKLTERVGDRIRIVSDPPLVVPLAELLPAADAEGVQGKLNAQFRSYTRSLTDDRRKILESYRVVDVARKVVGVGSVGTRCWIVLMLGRDDRDPLFLQIKQAEASVLEPFVAKSTFRQHGERVVSGQRMMQAASDIFLGWDHGNLLDDIDRHFYVRQLWDGKISADLTTMPPALLPVYGGMCGWTLARAHARSGDRIAIAAYLGSGDIFDRAMVEFAFRYAAQNTRDYEAVAAAAREGDIPVA